MRSGPYGPYVGWKRCNIAGCTKRVRPTQRTCDTCRRLFIAGTRLSGMDRSLVIPD